MSDTDYRVVWYKSVGAFKATNNHLTRDTLPLCGKPVEDAKSRLCETPGENDCAACQMIADNKLEQCNQCKLWFPEYEPFDSQTNRTHCVECDGHDLHYSIVDNRYHCLNCGHAMEPRKVKPLDGIDEDGVMSHVSGKPALEPVCIFCDQPNEEHPGCTRGISLDTDSDSPKIGSSNSVALRAWNLLRNYLEHELTPLSGQDGIAELWDAMQAVQTELENKGFKLYPHQREVLRSLLKEPELRIVPLPASYMSLAGLLPPKFDDEGNACGFIVLRFGSRRGDADFWNGSCWWSFREFSNSDTINRYPVGAVFTTYADAKQFVEQHAR